MKHYCVTKTYIVNAVSLNHARILADESRMMRLVDTQVSKCARRSQARVLPSAREVNRKGSKR